MPSGWEFSVSEKLDHIKSVYNSLVFQNRLCGAVEYPTQQLYD